MRVLFAVLAAVAIAGTIAVLAPWASSAGSGSGSTYEPVLDPANFTTTIDNPYFPLPVGRTWVYQGVKDGQTQEDRVTVTSQTKVVAEGITARVVSDVATHNGTLLEKTSDWHAQDRRGDRRAKPRASGGVGACGETPVGATSGGGREADGGSPAGGDASSGLADSHARISASLASSLRGLPTWFEYVEPGSGAPRAADF